MSGLGFGVSGLVGFGVWVAWRLPEGSLLTSHEQGDPSTKARLGFRVYGFGFADRKVQGFCGPGPIHPQALEQPRMT